MKRLWPIVLLLLVAATSEETRMYRVARATFGDGLYEVAERQFVEFLTRFPGSGYADEIQLLLAQAQLNEGKWPEAVLTLQQALSRWPDKRPDSYRFWLAEAMVRGEKFAEAEKLYAEVLDKHPGSVYRAQAQYGLAYTQFKLNQPEAAIQSLEKLPRLSPKGELAQNGELLRGQIYVALTKFSQADDVFNVLIAKFPDSRVFYRAHYWAGESLSRQGKYAEALVHYLAVRDSFKTNPNKLVDSQLAAEAWFGTGWVNWQQGQFDNAADAFAQALAHAQSVSFKRDAMLKLAESRVRGGKIQEGVTQFKAFLTAHPADPLADEVQLAIGNLLFGGEDYAGALAEYTQLITKYPQSTFLVKAHFNAGWSAWKLNKPAEALPHFQQVLTLTKDPAMAAEALFKVADLQFVLGQFPDAIGSYQRLITTYDKTKLIDRAMFQLGQAYQRVRNAEAAIAVFDSLAGQYPSSEYAPEALFQKGLILVGAGREPEARAAFGEVTKKFAPTDWANRAALSIGESYRREGQYEASVATFDKLIAVAPNSALAHRALYGRGWCYAAMGQPDKTLGDFVKFLQEHPDSPVAPEVRFWIAYHYMGQKDFIKAQEQFQLLWQNHPANKLADTALHFAARAAYARQDYRAAIELFELLVKSYSESPWRCDARFGQGDALSEQARFDDALLLFDSLIKEFPNCDLVCEAWGRKGDCQFTLGRYDDAIASYRNASACAARSDPGDSSLRHQIQYKLGLSFEKADKLNDAFEQYSLALVDSAVAIDTNAPPERVWACKAGLAASTLKEKQEQWREAIKIYQRLGDVCPDMKPLAEERIRRIRVEHFILF